MSRTAAIYRLALATGLALLVGCKPPPTDATITRDLPEAAPTYASDPLPSPDSQGAIWALSPNNAQRLIYGVPGSPALLALTCLADGEDPRLRLTRLSPADEGAGALMALVGNGHMGRIEVDAVEAPGRNGGRNGGRSVWRGEVSAADEDLEPLAGPRSLTVTVPGAGMITIEGNALAMQFLEACRSG